MPITAKCYETVIIMILDNISSEDRDKRILGLVKLSNLDKLRRLRVVNRLIIMRPTHGDVKVSTGVRVV